MARSTPKRQTVVDAVQTTPTHPVGRPVMRSTWRQLAYLHWSYPPGVVDALLPDGLVADVAPRADDGEPVAWVGLVPFRIGVGLPVGGPTITFPETNVRTYVVGPDGGRGVFFFSLDATNLPGVLTARTTYRLPYFWSDMAIEHTRRPGGDEVTYRCERRWPGPGLGATSNVRLRLGDPVPHDEVTDLDVFLSARWSLYAPWGDRMTRGHMDHEEWPLRRAEALEVDDELVVAAGLPAPDHEPLVRYSDGVDVRVDRPRVVG